MSGPRPRGHNHNPAQNGFQLNNEASYDNGLVCSGTLESRKSRFCRISRLHFGSGHISMALAKSANAAGFGIVVIDDREQFANKERFPMARRFSPVTTRPRANCPTLRPIWSSSPAGIAATWTSRRAVRTKARYIGMIGKRKVLSVYQALEKEATEEFKAFTRRWNEVGALPEEIAISIALELVRCAVGRNPRNTRNCNASTAKQQR
jgi:xanthine dehydrogenase accessory factor